ncbi:uncharacterized protein MELLADRAFT_33600 [Melampsora larici-populina 98AG31]|uniref:Nitrate reductase [NADPH] n=1 Tax=Melampsora larici-populina (strain 98AG31 / pathotype 3-4-7) TaxID=747676 RepID=F4RA56_MELLP|nr:uncharacterized protein MELLADRAFT_33600 [Melampsora larici-populina 98AG31]EGG10841.1 hypothetical protein MELLADRAFT_33600 [Melampsora larici-populina 98AG31]
MNPADKGTPDAWVKRDERLIRLTGRHPFNCEAPLTDLYDAGFLTPSSLFYVRNHGAVPEFKGKDPNEWMVKIDGLVKRPMNITLGDLRRGHFQTVTLPVTMVCAGNRRKEQNAVAQSLGFSWGSAGTSTALFTGVYLSEVLEYVGAMGIRDGARHVVFEGADVLPDGPYGTSQTINTAKDKGKGLMLAWAMNGLPLEPDHGYPLRLVVPGQIGGRSVKWLTKITVSEKESQHHLHFRDNKVLPTELTADRARTESQWWYDPKYIINDLNVNSVTCYPQHEEIIEMNKDFSSSTSDRDQGSEPSSYNLRGYAYAGGGRRVNRVEYSLDGGVQWKLASIVYPEDLFRKIINQEADPKLWGTFDVCERDQCFCWCFWNVQVSLKDLANADVFMVRAMDSSLALQPRDMYWNPTGMMNNWWHRVAIHKTEVDGKLKLRFEHPTLAGVQTGGWMQRMKDEGQDISKPIFGDAASASAEPKKPAPKPQTVKMTKDDVVKTITLSELESHGAESSEPWFIVNGQVYDGTAFLSQHPGGAESIKLAAGEDATDDFMGLHSASAKKQLAGFHIGTIANTAGDSEKSEKTNETTTISEVFLDKKKWKRSKLTKVIKISQDTSHFTFALESEDQSLGLPTGQHVYLRVASDDGTFIQRAYTPISKEHQKGTIEFVIKLYLPSKQFPEGGKMSVALSNVKVGDQIDMKGPLGSFIWFKDGACSWKGTARHTRNLALICGGSGVTPIIQVIRGVLEDETDSETKMWLIDANRTQGDILLYKELNELETKHPDRLKVFHVLSNADDEWKGERGRVTKDHLNQHLPSPDVDTMAFYCGPPGLLDQVVTPNLKELGWDLERNLVLF